MDNEINQTPETPAVIYVDFKRGEKPVSPALSAEEIYALFAPRFGVVFTEWFIDQYKNQQT